MVFISLCIDIAKNKHEESINNTVKEYNINSKVISIQTDHILLCLGFANFLESDTSVFPCHIKDVVPFSK